MIQDSSKKPGYVHWWQVVRYQAQAGTAQCLNLADIKFA